MQERYCQGLFYNGDRRERDIFSVMKIKKKYEAMLIKHTETILLVAVAEGIALAVITYILIIVR